MIDPRQEGLGKIADWWIPITPGSDGALALAMLKLIIDSGRYDHEFIEKYTRGFEEFKAYLDTQTMEQLSKWCGISVTDIEKLIDIFCFLCNACRKNRPRQNDIHKIGALSNNLMQIRFL